MFRDYFELWCLSYYFLIYPDDYDAVADLMSSPMKEKCHLKPIKLEAIIKCWKHGGECVL